MSDGLEKLEFVRPADIEARSMQIITSELGDRQLDPENASVIKRVIHTTADFDFADTLEFSPGAVSIGIKALQDGCSIVTDTKMAAAGINKRAMVKLGGVLHNFMADPSVAVEAKRREITRSAVCMERAAMLNKPIIVAVGNAPTALVRLYEMIQANEMRNKPVLIVGVPVGFVNVEESKELITTLDVPYIISRGRKGGSTVAAAICNAMIYKARGFYRE